MKSTFEGIWKIESNTAKCISCCEWIIPKNQQYATIIKKKKPYFVQEKDWNAYKQIGIDNIRIGKLLSFKQRKTIFKYHHILCSKNVFGCMECLSQPLENIQIKKNPKPIIPKSYGSILYSILEPEYKDN